MPKPPTVSSELQRRAQFRRLMAQSRSPNKAEKAAAVFLLNRDFNKSAP